MNTPGKMYLMVGEWHPQVKKLGFTEFSALGRKKDFNSHEGNCGQRFHILADLEAYELHEDKQIHKMIWRDYPKLWNYKEWFELTSGQAITILKLYAKWRWENMGLRGYVRVNPFNDKYFDPITQEPTIPGFIPMWALPQDWRKGKRLTFKDRGVPIGRELEWSLNRSIKCYVASDKYDVIYNGETFPSVSNLACHLKKRHVGTVSGPSFWLYNDTPLDAIFDGITDYDPYKV